MKGMDANLFIIDEAARVPEVVVSEGVAPMLVVKHTAVIMISTNMGFENFFTKLFRPMPSHLEQLFVKFHVDLFCNDCRAKKLSPKDCNHNADRYPPWLDARNQERSQIFMSSDVYAREVLGAVSDGEDNVLDKGDIKILIDHILNPWMEYAKKREELGKQTLHLLPDKRKLMEKKVQAMLQTAKNAGHTTDRLPKGSKCLSFIDPAGGGTQSDYAVMSIIITPGTEHPIYIVGMGCYSGAMRAENMGVFFAKYWKRLEENRLFQLCASQHYVGIERNYGGTFNSFMCVEQYVKPYLANRFIPLKDPNEAGTTHEHKQGLLTNQMNKFNGVQVLMRLLSQGEKGIVIAQEVATAGRSTVSGVIYEFGDQLLRLREKDGKYSAKQAPDKKDDMLICLILGLYWLFTIHVVGSKFR